MVNCAVTSHYSEIQQALIETNLVTLINCFRGLYWIYLLLCDSRLILVSAVFQMPCFDGICLVCRNSRGSASAKRQ